MLAQCERLLDAEPTTPEHHDHRPQSKAVRVIACVAHHADDLLDCRWIGWVEHSLVAGSALRESRGASPVSGVARQSRASTRRSWVLLPFAQRIVRAAPPGRRCPRKRARRLLGPGEAGVY